MVFLLLIFKLTLGCFSFSSRLFCYQIASVSCCVCFLYLFIYFFCFFSFYSFAFFMCVSIVGVCSSNSLATRWGTRNLIYILTFILLRILLKILIASYSSNSFLLFYSSLLTSSSIVAVFIAKVGHVWVSWPGELYWISYRLYCNRFAIVKE